MYPLIDRRDLGKRMSAAVGVLLTGTLIGDGAPADQHSEHEDKRLVRLGIIRFPRIPFPNSA